MVIPSSVDTLMDRFIAFISRQKQLLDIGPNLVERVGTLEKTVKMDCSLKNMVRT